MTMDDQDKKATEIPAFLRRRPVGAGDGGTYVVGEQWYQSEIERLQRELAACIKRRRELDDESYEHAERAEKAERERDEAWAIAARLWWLLDDIDTQDDASRSDDKHFRDSVRHIQRKRFEILSGERADQSRAALGGEG